MGNRAHEEIEHMGKETGSKTIKYGLSGIVVFLVLVLVLLGDRWWGKPSVVEEYVLIGDSIFGQLQGEGAVTTLVEEQTGISVCNAAMGGTSLSYLGEVGHEGYTKDVLSLEALSRAIAAGDFGAQQTVHIRENGTEHFDETIDYLSAIDFQQTKILFLCYGINDYHAGVPIENEKDPMDVRTFSGALRSALHFLKEAYPDMRIVLITPTYSWYPGLKLTCQEYDLGGGNLEAYVEAQLAAAQECGVECIDIFHDFYSHEQFEDWKTYTSDGVHPNDRGREMLAEMLASYLEEQ